MKTQQRGIVSVLLLVIVLAIVVYFLWNVKMNREQQMNNNATSTTQTPPETQAVSDGIIKMTNVPSDFGVTGPQDQPDSAGYPTSYLPACNNNFEYCLFYKGLEYDGTNFEGADVRVLPRPDLANERLCLATPPSGFDATKTPDHSRSSGDFSSSVFEQVGDAAAGHSSTGSLYRLYIRGVPAYCYEFQTSIKLSQFQNYPAGTIREFSQADTANMQAKLKQIIDGISLQTGAINLFP